MTQKRVAAIEPMTVLLIVACYGGLAFSTTWLAQVSTTLAILLTTLLITFHSSLQHEALHGHPTRIKWLNELLVFPAVGLFVPYGRFRDTHIAHHVNEILTDPYDDPESNFQDPNVWAGLPAWRQGLYRINNTLLGRILLGPMISEISFIRNDIRKVQGGQRSILICWALHILGVALVVWWLFAVASIALWAYVIAAYLGYGILKIRTFLEHRAFEAAPGRSVIIEDHGLLAFLFLNNNLHAVHHAYPGAPWYDLPGLYLRDRQGFLARNHSYLYPSYLPVFRKYLLHAKDPVPHPLRPSVKPH